MKKQEWFILPNMRLHRDDVEEFISNSSQLSNSQMQNIANKMSNYFMHEWNETLRIVCKEVL